MRTAQIIKKIVLSSIMIVAGTAIILLTGCQKSHHDQSSYSIETIDRVKYIHNFGPQSDNSSKASLKLLGQIGKLEAKKEEDLLYEPADAARLPNGDILILERGSCTVKRYSEDYEYISSFGQKGRGPGDFLSPFCLRLSEEKLYVADYSLSIFSIEGEYEGGFKPERIGGSWIHDQYRNSGMTVLSGSRVVLPSHPSIWVDSGDSKLLSMYGKKGTLIRSFGTPKKYENSLLMLNANIFYFDKDSTGHIYVAFRHQNRIDKYSTDGELIFSADRPLAYEVKNITKYELFKSGDKEIKIPWPSVSSVTKGIGIDNKNRVWVLTYLKQPNKLLTFDEGENLTECYEFNVFDSNGILLFNVSFPNVMFDKFSIYDDRVYLIDSQNESCVYEYKIVETIRNSGGRARASLLESIK